jgi:hypothetical protein
MRLTNVFPAVMLVVLACAPAFAETPQVAANGVADESLAVVALAVLAGMVAGRACEVLRVRQDSSFVALRRVSRRLQATGGLS